MLPRTHILYGILLSVVVYLVMPDLSLFYILLIFLSSFLIDFDHYVNAVIYSGKWNFRDIFDFYEIYGEKMIRKKMMGIRKKGIFQFFHTIEFHILVFLLSFIWIGFFYIFIGMLYHSLLDLIDLIRRDVLYEREYFFVHWLYKQIK